MWLRMSCDLQNNVLVLYFMQANKEQRSCKSKGVIGTGSSLVRQQIVIVCGCLNRYRVVTCSIVVVHWNVCNAEPTGTGEQC